ncbi:MAG TPA: hypothetical protein ENK12_00810 [Gammaproteobacteria bacterium]|nr:hypothetical protein [Gammaproteobacteria bacterium]
MTENPETPRHSGKKPAKLPARKRTTKKAQADGKDRSAAAPVPASRAGSPLPLVLAAAALVVAVGLAVAQFFAWNELQQLQRAQERLLPRVEDKVAEVERGFERIQSGLEDTRRTLSARLDELQRQQQAGSERLAALAAVVGRSDAGWALAEAAYLLRLASQRLQLAADPVTASAALDSADAVLRELGDPHYQPVREAIAREREALRALPAVDIDGLSARLTALVDRVGALPLAASQYQAAAPAPAESTEPRQARDWRDLPRVIWNALRELVSIREHDKPVQPMLPPEREYFLRLNLRLQLEGARLALLRQDPALYRDSLAAARRWLAAYFDDSDAAVQQALQELDDLAATDIRPPLPDISASLRLLRQQMKLASPHPVAGESPAPSPAEVSPPPADDAAGAEDARP